MLAGFAMHETRGEDRVETIGYVSADPKGVSYLQASLATQPVGERAALDETLHQIWDAIVLARVQHGHHVAVGYPLRDTHLAIEASPKDGVPRQLLAHQLERNRAVVVGERVVDPSHAADPEQRGDAVGADRRADQRIELLTRSTGRAAAIVSGL